MSEDTAIARCQVHVDDAVELRMRMAAEFVCLAGQFRSDVWVIYEGRRYNGRSMRDLMNMSVEAGARLDLEAQGHDAEEAVTALARAFRPLAGGTVRCS